MAANRETFPIEFKGGLISNLSPLQQGLNAVGSATILQNFEPAKTGGYKKVLGYSKYIEGAVPGSGAMLGVKVINAEKVICVRKNASDKSEYYLNVGAAWSSLGAASSLGTKVRGATFNFNGDLKTFFVDGVNSPGVFNEATDTLTFPAVSASFPVDLTGSSYAVEVNGTVFLGNKTNLIFSSLFNELDWSAGSGGGIVNIGKKITGLVPFRDQLIIFTEGSIKRLSGSSSTDFALASITDDVGCPFPDTIQEVGGDIMFMGPDGIRFLSASARIDDFGLELASDPVGLDFLNFKKVATIFTSVVLREKAQYRIFSFIEANDVNTSSGLLATKFSNQDTSNVQWGSLLGFKVGCADGKYDSGREYIVFGNETDYIYKMEDQFSRDGEPISAVYESPFMPITDPTKRKTLYRLMLSTKTTGSFEISVNFAFDIASVRNYNRNIFPPTINITSAGSTIYTWGSEEAIYGTMVYGGRLDDIYDTQLIGSGKTFSFRIEDNSTNPSFTLDTAIIEYREHDRQ